MRVLVELFAYLNDQHYFDAGEHAALIEALGIDPFELDFDQYFPGGSSPLPKKSCRVYSTRATTGAPSRASDAFGWDGLADRLLPRARLRRVPPAKRSARAIEALESLIAAHRADWETVLQPLSQHLRWSGQRPDDPGALSHALKSQPLWVILGDLDRRDVFQAWWQLLVFKQSLVLLEGQPGSAARILRRLLANAGTLDAVCLHAYDWVLGAPMLRWLHQFHQLQYWLRVSFASALRAQPQRLFRWAARGRALDAVPALVLAWYALRLDTHSPTLMSRDPDQDFPRTVADHGGPYRTLRLPPSDPASVCVLHAPHHWPDLNWEWAGCLCRIERLRWILSTPGLDAALPWALELPSAWLGKRQHDLFYLTRTGKPLV